MDNIWLDADQKFYNYRTADIDGNNIFDIHKASNSDAQQLLDGSEYWRKEKNTYSEIVYMTPIEYFTRCAEDCFNEPVQKLIDSRRRDSYTLQHLKDVLQVYKKRFPICYIDYATHRQPQQEGLHRMMVAGDLYGWDTKFPVQIIRWVDIDKAAKEKELKHIREIENYLDRAVRKALRYKYYNINELKIQLIDEFSNESQYIDEFENRNFNLELERLDDIFKVTVDDKYTATFAADDVMMIDPIQTDADELEDLDPDDFSDWMKELLADINVNESLFEEYAIPRDYLLSDELHADLVNKFGEDFSYRNISKDICRYIAQKCPKCNCLDFITCVWRKDDEEFDLITDKNYAVIEYQDQLYDFTCNAHLDAGITECHEVPRILNYEKELSEAFRMNIYSDNEYAISVA